MNFLSLSFLLTFLFLLQTTFAADEQQQQQQQQVGPPSHLLESVMRNDYDGVRHALENGEDINLVNVDGFSAARVAVELSNLQMLQFLIEHRIDLNNADLNGVTPLMVASQLVSFPPFFPFPFSLSLISHISHPLPPFPFPLLKLLPHPHFLFLIFSLSSSTHSLKTPIHSFLGSKRIG